MTVTYEDMDRVFCGGLVQLDVAEAREKGLSDDDARILGDIGLPVRADHAFTTLLDGEPGVGSFLVFQSESGDIDVLIIGGTSPDGMLYFLDLRDGTVGILSLDGEPQTEQVNSSLADFVTFLHRVRLRQDAAMGADGDAQGRCTEELQSALEELDPLAFRSPESWWSMVMDHLMKREQDYIKETRAYLQQRRAEDAAPGVSPNGPATAGPAE